MNSSKKVRKKNGKNKTRNKTSITIWHWEDEDDDDSLGISEYLEIDDIEQEPAGVPHDSLFFFTVVLNINCFIKQHLLFKKFCQSPSWLGSQLSLEYIRPYSWFLLVLACGVRGLVYIKGDDRFNPRPQSWPKIFRSN